MLSVGANLPVISVKIKYKVLTALIDSGSNQSCINSVYVDNEIGNLSDSPFLLKSFNGDETKNFGFLNTKINFGPFKSAANLAVVPSLNYDLIIGLDTVDSLSIKKNSKTFEIEKITVNGFNLTPSSVF